MHLGEVVFLFFFCTVLTKYTILRQQIAINPTKYASGRAQSLPTEQTDNIGAITYAPGGANSIPICSMTVGSLEASRTMIRPPVSTPSDSLVLCASRGRVKP